MVMVLKSLNLGFKAVDFPCNKIMTFVYAETAISKKFTPVYHVEKPRPFISPPYFIWSCYKIFLKSHKFS